MMKISEIESLIQHHYQYLQKDNFRGWDVFDGLNSRLLQKSPFYNSRLVRLGWTQFLKKAPFNFRSLLLVPRGDNPKALALFIPALLNLYTIYGDHSYLDQAFTLYERLMAVKVESGNTLGWGYNFPWQARAFYVPVYRPNMVVSTFAGHALIDLYEETGEESYFNRARKVGNFILDRLILWEDSQTLCFRYIPGEKAVVHNANLLGAAFLARLFAISGERALKEKAAKSVLYSVNAQRGDGAWVYGQRKHHQWVDNFHTGYNLTAIYDYQRYCRDKQFEPALIKGLEYHRKNHFSDQYLPKYSDVSLYPLDIHCFSQSIISAITLKDYWQEYGKVLEGVLTHLFNLMYDRDQHYFYYQKKRFYTIKTPYIRWSQAWMFYTLTSVIRSMRNGEINLD